MTTRARRTTIDLVHRHLAMQAANWLIENKGGTWPEVKNQDLHLWRLRPTLGRLHRGEAGSLRHEVFRSIARQIELKMQLDEDDRPLNGGADMLRRLFGAVGIASAFPFVNHHRGWVRTRIDRGLDVEQRPFYRRMSNGPVRVVGRTREIAARRRRRETLFLEVMNDESLRKLLENFKRSPEALRHSSARIELAIVRIMEPIEEAAESGFFECDWAELSLANRRKFVQAGITREKILLGRTDGLERYDELRSLCRG